jgi:hypothetical protein
MIFSFEAGPELRAREPVISITDTSLKYDHAIREMIRKSISAVVLASICWLGIPVAFGAMQTRPLDRNWVVRSRALDHSCCPSLDPRTAPTVLAAIYPPVMPCGEPHPCCARRSPSAPPNAPAKGKLIRPAAEAILIISPEKPPRAGRRTVKTSADLFLPAPFERGTVLRN